MACNALQPVLVQRSRIQAAGVRALHTVISIPVARGHTLWACQRSVSSYVRVHTGAPERNTMTLERVGSFVMQIALCVGICGACSRLSDTSAQDRDTMVAGECCIASVNAVCDHACCCLELRLPHWWPFGVRLVTYAAYDIPYSCNGVALHVVVSPVLGQLYWLHEAREWEHDLRHMLSSCVALLQRWSGGSWHWRQSSWPTSRMLNGSKSSRSRHGRWQTI